VERHGREVEFRQCGLPYIRGRVVGVSPQLIDIMPSEPRFPYCPPETDNVARSPLATGLSDLWLCLDTKPGDGNTPRYDLKLWTGSLREGATYPPA
jgi:hypothetical protein